LPASNQWTTVVGAPSIIGNQAYVTNPVSGGNAFYRLVFP
jgi:hypothetical protein